jgi:hypothetical protein
MIEKGETRLDAEARVGYASTPGSVDDGLENELGPAPMNRRIILATGSLILLWSPIALGQQQTNIENPSGVDPHNGRAEPDLI